MRLASLSPNAAGHALVPASRLAGKKEPRARGEILCPRWVGRLCGACRSRPPCAGQTTATCTGVDVPNRTERHNTAAQATDVAGMWKESRHVRPPDHVAAPDERTTRVRGFCQDVNHQFRSEFLAAAHQDLSEEVAVSSMCGDHGGLQTRKACRLSPAGLSLGDFLPKLPAPGTFWQRLIGNVANVETPVPATILQNVRDDWE